MPVKSVRVVRGDPGVGCFLLCVLMTQEGKSTELMQRWSPGGWRLDYCKFGPTVIYLLEQFLPPVKM